MVSADESQVYLILNSNQVQLGKFQVGLILHIDMS